MLTKLRNLAIYLMSLLFLAGCLVSEKPLLKPTEKPLLPEKFEIRKVKGLERWFKYDQTFIYKEGRYINVTEERKRDKIIHSFIVDDLFGLHGNYVFQIPYIEYVYVVASEREKNRFDIYEFRSAQFAAQWRELETRVRRGVGSEFENGMYDVFKDTSAGTHATKVDDYGILLFLLTTSFLSKEECQELSPQYWQCALLTLDGTVDLLQFP